MYVRNVTLHLIHCRKFSATLEVLYGTVQYVHVQETRYVLTSSLDKL